MKVLFYWEKTTDIEKDPIDYIFQITQQDGKVRTVEYWMPIDSRVKITLYNILGQRFATLVDGNIDKGLHIVTLNASDYNLASGIYIYRMIAEGIDRELRFVKTRKLTIIK